MEEVFPSDAIDGGVMYADIARQWRMEVGLVGPPAIEDPDRAERVLRKTERRLSAVLA
jgi:hypothetical protein